MRPIRVFIVDDSALVRRMLAVMLAGDPGIEVLGSAPDPLIAAPRIASLQPDVLTLDVEMPGMDGLSFLERIMRTQPIPVLMVSALTRDRADIALKALELGAYDYVTKPGSDLSGTFSDSADEIIAKVKAAAASRPRIRGEVLPASARRPSALNGMPPPVPPRLDADAVLPRLPPLQHLRQLPSAGPVIAIGASAGGTEAIREVLVRMPADAPPILITQHIPAVFSAAFAARMDRDSPMCVCEAADGQAVLRGHAYIAPGGRHLLLARDGARFVCKLHDGPAVSRHKPSVDVLFRSVALAAGAQAVAAILTGMGDDGARGLLELREAGAPTLAQDEASSVVWGMPGAAWKLGAAAELVSLPMIAARLLQWSGYRPGCDMQMPIADRAAPI